MKRLRRVVLSVAVLVLIISIILLMNITASNPTRRRYSSEMPITMGKPNLIGDDGERILSNDLRLPNNNSNGQKQCICGSSSSNGGCKVCIAQIPGTSNRIPDFVTDGFIADSKNEQGLLYIGNKHDTEQIRDFVVASLLTNRRLYIYVRMNTVISSEFIQLVESTGGAVVPYFTVPAYLDPVDDTSRKSAAASGVVLIGMAWLEWRSFRKRSFTVPVPRSPKPLQPVDPIISASRKITHAEDFTTSAKERLQAKVDEDDVWNDL
ncbi:MAG: hypothetical protein H0X30_02670 [Anaerolineae bacterium]|nr:hypothetical protein [Anaerolineae bacterium]